MRSQNETLTISEIEVMLEQFHDHVDRAIVHACRGRHERAAAYLAAARRLVDVLPSDVIDYFEMSGHLAGVIRGLDIDIDQPLPLNAA
jgi:hypothetical protein